MLQLPRPSHSLIGLVFVCLFFSSFVRLTAEDTPFTNEQIEFFERKIRPIFVEHCQECHGPDEQEASLRLDSRAAILKGGDTGPAVIPGDLNAGELVAAIQYDPDGYQMPPDGKLPQEKIDLLIEWVKIGAPWAGDVADSASTGKEFDLSERAQHWSFLALANHQPPVVAELDWCRNEIDRFILAKLEEHELTHHGEADRRTWIRRAYFDVIGLPPTPEQVERFLQDESPKAYESVVEELLDSPHFGERWGRHWLDVVRYAESRGHEFDHNVTNAWQYRDYVIRALNNDVPFDQFVIEHVAGDLLSKTTSHQIRINPNTGANESILGTGFWFLGEWIHSPVDIRQDEADRFDNMIDVYSKAFLGLTVACARCHDHKFDPIRQADYYALQGFLQSSSYQQARFETQVHNEQTAELLEKIERETSEILQETLPELVSPVCERLEDYLVNARTLAMSAKETGSAEVLIESFESGDYGDWTTTGDAFGETPQSQQTIMPYQGDVAAQGAFFINSHQKRNGGRGDDCVGTLTSPEFKITLPYLNFLIGGGNDPERTCVQLLIGEKVERVATGRNANRMHPESWDVANLLGQRARIRIVDQATGGWGNIGADAFILSSVSAKNSNESIFHAEIDQVEAQRLADSRGLDVDILTAWAELLTDHRDSTETESLLHSFSRGSSVEEFKSLAAEILRKRDAARQAPEAVVFSAEDLIASTSVFQFIDAQTTPFLELTENPQQPLHATFGESYVKTGPLWSQLQEPSGNMAEPGAMGSWSRSRGILRTPTFDITAGKIFCLVRGNVNTYAAVDSHLLIAGPLHGSLTRQHNGHDFKAGWHWISHDVSAYLGHDAHLELVPADGDGFEIKAVVVADDLDQVQWHSEQSTEFAEILSQEIADHLKAPQSDFPSIFAKTIRDELRTATRKSSLVFIAEHPGLFGLVSDEAQLRLRQRIERMADAKNALQSRAKLVSATAPSMLDGTCRDEYIFIRGNWKKKGETVPRRFLEVFDADPVNASGSGRLTLAEQMVDPQQTPILPRVIVNRIWQHYFGRGICPTSNDFGHLGQLPSHPELLDWLALKLVDEQWSLKSIHRFILLSATYRMSSEANANDQITRVDPDNVLLHRMNVKRMEGEIIRDAMLAVSGRFDPTMYGPSVPIHLTDFLDGRGRPGESGPVDGNGRRSLYIAVRRNFPEPFFTAFDLPTPHSSIGHRNVSNVPAQALALLNNPMVVEQAENWSRRLVRETPDASMEDRVRHLFNQAFSRDPNHSELRAAIEFITVSGEPTNADDWRAWSDYCHVLFNLKEFIFVE